ncbi:NRDE family protein, partial [Tepidimonas sp.]|uniref:NRDE family protein n=1 Tax=Tepidimonas sp. TaxID=2002775 RepID=UPI0028CDD766
MCLMAWAIGQSTEHPLWVAANRDEQWDRPTLALDVWHSSDGTTILGGRDGTRSSLIARWSADGSLHVGEWIYAPQ